MLVEIVGGPKDGERIEVLDGTQEIIFPEKTDFNPLEDSSIPNFSRVEYRQRHLEVVLTKTGYKAYWHKRINNG